MDPSFADFLRQKRIDPEKWARGETEAGKRLHILAYKMLGKTAYEQRYLFYFNRWRKLYPLSEASGVSAT
ncbi:MAG: hypothetical protein N3E49_05775 [Bacteroidia bacterium]|nr:hypothetical protein [Bacteroidia bacterium]